MLVTQIHFLRTTKYERWPATFSQLLTYQKRAVWSIIWLTTNYVFFCDMLRWKWKCQYPRKQSSRCVFQNVSDTLLMYKSEYLAFLTWSMPKSQTSLDKFFAPTENASRNTQKMKFLSEKLNLLWIANFCLFQKMDFFSIRDSKMQSKSKRQMMFIVQTLTWIRVV